MNIYVCYILYFVTLSLWNKPLSRVLRLVKWTPTFAAFSDLSPSNCQISTSFFCIIITVWIFLSNFGALSSWRHWETALGLCVHLNSWWEACHYCVPLFDLSPCGNGGIYGSMSVRCWQRLLSEQWKRLNAGPPGTCCLCIKVAEDILTKGAFGNSAKLH